MSIEKSDTTVVQPQHTESASSDRKWVKAAHDITTLALAARLVFVPGGVLPPTQPALPPERNGRIVSTTVAEGDPPEL